MAPSGHLPMSEPQTKGRDKKKAGYQPAQQTKERKKIKNRSFFCVCQNFSVPLQAKRVKYAVFDKRSICAEVISDAAEL